MVPGSTPESSPDLSTPEWGPSPGPGPQMDGIRWTDYVQYFCPGRIEAWQCTSTTSNLRHVHSLAAPQVSHRRLLSLGPAHSSGIRTGTLPQHAWRAMLSRRDSRGPGHRRAAMSAPAKDWLPERLSILDDVLHLAAHQRGSDSKNGFRWRRSAWCPCSLGVPCKARGLLQARGHVPGFLL